MNTPSKEGGKLLRQMASLMRGGKRRTRHGGSRGQGTRGGKGRDRVIHIRLSPAELEIAQARARKVGETISAYARRLLSGDGGKASDP